MMADSHHTPQRPILFHCPEELEAEMRVICENNHWNRTSFIITACKLMLQRLQEQSLSTPQETTSAIIPDETENYLFPEEEEDVLMAAEEEDSTPILIPDNQTPPKS